MTIDTYEMLSWTQNDNTICTAILEVSAAADTKDICAFVDAVNRAQQLILQALKSNQSLRLQIRDKNE